MITARLDQELRQAKEITLVGYYGVNNFGDDLMLKSLLDKLEPYSLKLNVISYGGLIPWLDPSIKVFHWTRGDKTGNIKMFLDAIASSSLVLWGGGTCFTDEDGDGLFRPMMIALLRGKKIAYVGVGIGNLKNKNRARKAKMLINLCSYISFRDTKSYELGRSWCKFGKSKIELIEDPANYLLQEMNYHWPQKESKDKRTLVLAWRNLTKYAKTTIGNSLEQVAELCVSLSKKHEMNRIVIINTDSHYDAEISVKLQEYLLKNKDGIEIEYNDCKSYNDKLRILLECDLIVTSRLHVGVAAHFLHKPCYVYNYSPKIQYFVEEYNSDYIEMLDQNFNITGRPTFKAPSNSYLLEAGNSVG